MWLFGAKLGWLPVFGTPTLKGIVLPTIVLALPTIAVLTRLVRSATLDVLGQDFVTVARAKGLTTRTVARRHVLPNALLPAMTVFGMELAWLLGGSAVVEYVFAWPGIGRLAIEAALVRDVPVVAGFAVAAALILILITLAVDLLAAVLDPRVAR
jgi:ABC-type dipeptide/oligopeptide/nickel transport system permease component